MKTVLKVSAALLAGGMLLGASIVSASPGVHWSPTFASGVNSWTDHHGRTIDVFVNFFNATWTAQSAGATGWHRASAVCTDLGGVPLYISNGAWALGSDLSAAGCTVGIELNPFGAGSTFF
jgi:hypothetical protein